MVRRPALTLPMLLPAAAEMEAAAVAVDVAAAAACMLAFSAAGVSDVAGAGAEGKTLPEGEGVELELQSNATDDTALTDLTVGTEASNVLEYDNDDGSRTRTHVIRKQKEVHHKEATVRPRTKEEYIFPYKRTMRTLTYALTVSGSHTGCDIRFSILIDLPNADGSCQTLKIVDDMTVRPVSARVPAEPDRGACAGWIGRSRSAHSSICSDLRRIDRSTRWAMTALGRRRCWMMWSSSGTRSQWPRRSAVGRMGGRQRLRHGRPARFEWSSTTRTPGPGPRYGRTVGPGCLLCCSSVLKECHCGQMFPGHRTEGHHRVRERPRRRAGRR